MSFVKKDGNDINFLPDEYKKSTKKSNKKNNKKNDKKNDKKK